MKIRYLYVLLVSACLTYNLDAFSQQAERVINLKLTDPTTKKTQTYLLNNVVYSFIKPQDNSKEDPGLCSINIDFKQEMDSFLLKWIAGEIKEAEGTITVTNPEIGKQSRTIVFKGGVAANTSESFMSTDLASYIQMSLYVKGLLIDGVSIYTEAKK